jgi:hypothetical protein
MCFLQVEVQRIWERDSRTIAVRWNLRCFPRLLDRSLVNLDGISEYHFNDKGLIYEHKVRTCRHLHMHVCDTGCRSTR